MITTGYPLRYRWLWTLASLAILWTFVSTALAAGVVALSAYWSPFRIWTAPKASIGTGWV